jgi:hypothetical protein
LAKIDWKDADGTVATVDRVDGRNGPSFTVVFTYKVDSHWCGGTFTTSDEYKVGDFVAVRYDPIDPDRNDLSMKEQRKQWLLWAFLGVIGLIILWATLSR